MIKYMTKYNYKLMNTLMTEMAKLQTNCVDAASSYTINKRHWIRFFDIAIMGNMDIQLLC